MERFRIYRRSLLTREDVLVGEYPAGHRHVVIIGGERCWKRSEQLDAGDKLEGIGTICRISRVPEEEELEAA